MRDKHVVVVGLGYVGLPLAIALAKSNRVTGFDLDASRVSELTLNFDRTGEVAFEDLTKSTIRITADETQAIGADVYIVTVPTPVDRRNSPDLSAVISASQAVARCIHPQKKPTIVFESTVYPGVTEDICGPAIETERSELKRGRDFRLGYSPERINPGDSVHRIETITKVVSGEDDEVVEQLALLYGSVNGGKIFRAASIRAAEAAKVIENAQRDINIAFMNEVAQIFSQMNLSVIDVLDAARTKWNFLPFEPGLVGGHCIGVDPYYLAHAAIELGHHPRVVLAGRETNDKMGSWIADQLHARRGERVGRVLILGLTFKEDVPDIRNSRVIDLVRRLETLGHEVVVSDPLADLTAASREYGVTLIDPNEVSGVDLLIAAVGHASYRAKGASWIEGRIAQDGMVADIKGIWRNVQLSPQLDRWAL